MTIEILPLPLPLHWGYKWGQKAGLPAEPSTQVHVTPIVPGFSLKRGSRMFTGQVALLNELSLQLLLLNF